MNTIRTREEWLLSGVAALKGEFFTGRKVPHVACSCGWTNRPKSLGICHPPEDSSNGTVNLFICPTQDDPVRILDVLLHELGHAHLGNEVGHKAPFVQLMKEFGLKGKPTATYALPGTDCYERLKRIADGLGPYPHAAMIKPEKQANKKKVTWCKVQSVNDPDYVFTFAMNPSVEEFGLPRDPWGDPMVEAGSLEPQNESSGRAQGTERQAVDERAE